MMTTTDDNAARLMHELRAARFELDAAKEDLAAHRDALRTLKIERDAALADNADLDMLRSAARKLNDQRLELEALRSRCGLLERENQALRGRVKS